MQSDVTDLFLKLVQIDSPSSEENAMRDFVINYLNNLGIKTEINNGNIIARVVGDGEPILFGAHLDTVEPGRSIYPRIADGIITSDGKTILGADNKAAIAAILIALQNSQGKSLRNLELVFSVREETDGGINQLDFSLLKSKQGIIADSILPIGSIVLSSPWIEDFEVKIIGRGAHASRPEEAINALTIAAYCLSTFTWGRVTDKTIANVGLIQGGVGTNTIPPEVTLRGEVRSFSQKEFQKTTKDVEKLFRFTSKKYRAQCEFVHKFYANGYVHRKDDTVVSRIVKTYEHLGIVPNFAYPYAVSDANTYVDRGIQIINIGDGVQNAHTTQESISVEALQKLTQIFEQIMVN